MKSLILALLFLLCGLACHIEGRGYLSKRPRPQTELPSEQTPISTKNVKSGKSVIDPAIRKKSVGCPRRRCASRDIPVSCRQETFFRSEDGRRCKGCDRNICQEKSLDTGNPLFTRKLASESDPIRDTVSRDRQNDGTLPSRNRNSNSAKNNLRSQNEFRNIDLFDTIFQNRRNSQSLIERGFPEMFPSESDSMMSRLFGQDSTGQNIMNNRDVGTRGANRRRQSPGLQNRRNRVPVTNNSWASPGFQ
ncbi:uncharacterized protein LOC132554167 [Ylistrum balloti]|uniref:uncharacterized protein LOC132554167 n=1 Tax=Ylistrum balloti TaxID=509963 RepID=UPI002905D6F6|nr:uncharacterized protein LOC132554167 [Ylistrum balloti]